MTKRLMKFFAITFVGTVFVGFYLIYDLKVMFVYKIDGYNWPEIQRQKAFDTIFPSAANITSSLSDKTFFVSGSAIETAAYYFNNSNRFYMLDSNGISRGKWWTY